MEKQLLDFHDIKALGIAGRTKLYHMVKAREFPQPLKYGRCNRWLASEVKKWQEDQAKRTEGAVWQG